MKTTGKDGRDLLGPREMIIQVPVEKKEIAIPLNIGYPWSVCQLDYVEHDSQLDKDFLPAEGIRTWTVEYLLSKNVALADEGGSLDQSAMGSSHLGLESDMEIKVRGNGSGEGLSFKLLRSPDNLLGKIVVPVSTDHPIKARVIAGRAVSGLLGVLSFQGNVPLHVSREVIRDPESGWARFWIVVCAPAVTLSRVKMQVHPDLRPVYALWRESRNSSSYFYRFLCLFKIVEGLLETILPRVYKKISREKKEFERFKGKVPDDKEINRATPEFVGKKFTQVRDELKGQYRNALAHFGLDDKPALDLDEPGTRYEYERLFPVVDYMARTLIGEATRLTAHLS
jgi:hypothetical protein